MTPRWLPLHASINNPTETPPVPVPPPHRAVSAVVHRIPLPLPSPSWLRSPPADPGDHPRGQRERESGSTGIEKGNGGITRAVTATSISRAGKPLEECTQESQGGGGRKKTRPLQLPRLRLFFSLLWIP
ncbi:hypothetical protein VPH35_110186 [Triticum aestivum]